MLTFKENKRTKISFENFKKKLDKEYEYLMKYFNLNSKRIENTINDLNESLINEIEENPENESIIYDFYEKQLASILSFYYHSSITLTHSYLEKQLYELCKLIQIESKTKLDISLLNTRDYIKSGLDYLVLTTDLSKTLLDKHKPRLGKFQKLRNKIIHSNSTYENEKDKSNLMSDFNDKIVFFEDEKKFFLKSDELPIEYLEISKIFFDEILNYLKTVDFIIPIEKINEEKIDLPF